MTDKEVKELLGRYLQGECTAKEEALIDAWYIQKAIDTPVDPADYIDTVNKKRSWETIVAKLGISK